MDYKEMYYRIFAEIDLDSISYNTEELKKMLKPGTGLTAVVKSDGYGHGAVPIAKTIEEKVDSFAVATVDEALILKKHDIKKPIYIIGFTHPSRMKEAIDNEIRLTVYDYETAQKISKNTEDGKTAYIHIKVDTGMSRIGFSDTKESVNTIKKISEFPNIKIEGIFTHFYNADNGEKEDSKKQMQRFDNFIQELKKKV